MIEKGSEVVVSVVIPMFNSENTILNTLNSIKNQTALRLVKEIIVVDDGSTDKSLSVVKEYKIGNSELPIIIIDKENEGVSSARNAGMKIAKGEWIALLDSDDKWLPNKIETQIRIIEKNPSIDFLGGNLEDKNLKILWRKTDTLFKAKIKDICLKMFPQTSTAIFRKTIFQEIGGYDENQNYAEDGNFFMKICSNYNYYHLNKRMVFFGDGKPEFGFSGLSANLNNMHKGNIKNINELKSNSIISKKFYLFLRAFYWLKYVRRIIVTKIRVSKSNTKFF
ncbi:glycosyltransferase family 2 protein [Clostridium sp. DL1XJH146]